MCRVLTVVAIAATLVAAVAVADDSSAVLGAGGIVLTHSANIRLAKEDLRISPKEVAARFTFLNEGKADLETIVAFPLPDIDTSRFSEEPLGRTTGDPVNFVGFSVSENGKNVPFQIEQRAFYKGRDVSGLVRRAGIPINIVDQGFTKALEHLSPERRKLLEAGDLADYESGSYEHPHWVVRTKFWWRQLFPAGKPVILDEGYRPVTGESLIGVAELNSRNEDGRYWLKTYCIDDRTRRPMMAMLAHNRSNPQNGNLLTALSTDYVLSTGNNWRGTIGQFRLVLDKLKPDNVLSLCWDQSLKQTAATTFESTRDNFAPKSDIRLLVLQPAPL